MLNQLMLNISWFQFLKCEDLPLFSAVYGCKLNVSGFLDSEKEICEYFSDVID